MSTPRTPEPSTPSTMWAELLAGWDAQQEVYINDREHRYQLMFDLIEQLASKGPHRILDIACGPGSLTHRILERFPDSQVVAVDMDPVLLTIGRRALASYEGRIEWIEEDLRNDEWLPAVGSEPFDVVVSSTATHWLSGPDLATLYQRVQGLLGPDGILLNADFMPLETPRIADAVRTVDGHRQRAATAAGAQSWEAWWESVLHVPELEPAVLRRKDLLESVDESSTDRATPHLDTHRNALRDAGFTEVSTVWQNLQEFLVVALC